MLCRPTKSPGISRAGLDSLGSMFTIDPILKDFVLNVTDPEYVPMQEPFTVSRRNHLRFHLPVELVGFQDDLVKFMYGPQLIPSPLKPIRHQDFDLRGRPRAVFLCDPGPRPKFSSEGILLEEVLESESSKWLRSHGYNDLSDLLIRNKNDALAWFQMVRQLNLPTKPLSLEEMEKLIEHLGDGSWVKGLTVSIDTTNWPGK